MTGDEPPEGESSGQPVTQEDAQRTLAAILERAGIDPSQQQLGVLSATVATASFQSPLPHPSVLKDYKEIIPNLPERIVSNWETEQQHRQKTTGDLMRMYNRHHSTGQWMSFAIAILGLGAAVALGLRGGHQWAVAVVATAALGVPTAISLMGARRKR